MSFPTARTLFPAEGAGPSLSRPPSFALSQPTAGPSRHIDFPSSPTSGSEDTIKELQRELDELFDADDADKEDGRVTQGSDSPQGPAATPTRRLRRVRRSEMNDTDVRFFLRFMSERNLSIKSLLSLFFDLDPGPKVPIPSDEMLSSSALNSHETVVLLSI
ncbi:unnamed protein product [Tilletia caries]|uniref:Uncharacterized protein n=2 Tax=Tilletia TaxID=13289 RepID=A0A8X7SSR0_9BASI|nr:hypothetical protein A4X06_0g8997 [Tilletia controversa]CAD6901258.1 unnamed protein product [Tilletia caries]CAD6906082.1 unnamed protein product [Tilletia caries]CAD6930869.1 unnamed protein product [Tilletia controversa]CAD6985121.1 unnamed protein product [Tilletia controversa]